MGVTTSVLLDSVNSGVAEVFVNQEELEREAKQLQTQSKRLASSANQWLAMVNELSMALKVAPPPLLGSHTTLVCTLPPPGH